MTTALRYDRYIGNIHYWIRFNNGTHEVRYAEPIGYNDLGYEDFEIYTAFKGHYEDCVKFIDECETEYLESLL